MTEYEVSGYIIEMQAIEEFFYESVESRWVTLPELLRLLVGSSEKFTLNGKSIDGVQADELVKYFFLEYYRKVQRDYKKPDFRSEILDPIECLFPDRTEFQIAVAKHPVDREVWRVRKRLFRRLTDR